MLLIGAFAAVHTQADPVRDGQVEAELIAESASIRPGTPFTVAVKFRIDPHWHTYWINDGDSGLATKLTWSLPEGYTAGGIQWPYPERIIMEPLVSYGYEDEVWHLVDITPPEDLPAGESVTLKVKATWLMCKEVCLPGKAELSLTLPVSDTPPAPNRAHAEGFASARANLPTEETAWTFTASRENDSLVLTMNPPEGFDGELERPWFFPFEKQVIVHAADQVFERAGDGYRLAMEIDPSGETVERLQGVITAGGDVWAPGRNAVAIDVLVGDSAGSVTDGDGSASVAAPPQRPLWVYLIFAFAGGLILNLMPCVFPVLSLKIMSFVNQAGHSRDRVWKHGLVFSAGVLISFWILAGLLMLLRAGGSAAGWGFQLSSPTFVLALIALFFLMSLNLFGVFEVGTGLTGTGSELTGKHGLTGSFFSGFLATIVATPCTAPMMGTALAFAINTSAATAFLIFTGLALGLSFPYLLLSRFPALLQKIPRPGPWMETLKQVMGFLLIATAVWLFWVFSYLVDVSSLSWVMVMLLLLAAGGWVLGKWGAIHRGRTVRITGKIIAIVLMTLGITSAVTRIEPISEKAAAADDVWEPYTAEKVAALRAEGTPVFIDFTAKWCLTCQVNKKAVLEKSDILALFRDNGVAMLAADWTDQNERVADALASYGRNSVPLYVYYAAGAEQPVILPEILTPPMIRDLLKSGG